MSWDDPDRVVDVVKDGIARIGGKWETTRFETIACAYLAYSSIGVRPERGAIARPGGGYVITHTRVECDGGTIKNRDGTITHRRPSFHFVTWRSIDGGAVICCSAHSLDNHAAAAAIYVDWCARLVRMNMRAAA